MAADALERSVPGFGGGGGIERYMNSYEDWVRAMWAR
jgi:hypothetical protein